MSNPQESIKLMLELEEERDKWRDLVDKREETLGLLQYYDEQIYFSKDKQRQLKYKINQLFGEVLENETI